MRMPRANHGSSIGRLQSERVNAPDRSALISTGMNTVDVGVRSPTRTCVGVCHLRERRSQRRRLRSIVSYLASWMQLVSRLESHCQNSLVSQTLFESLLTNGLAQETLLVVSRLWASSSGLLARRISDHD